MISSLREAKARLGELVQKAAAGEDVIITVRGEPVVRLSPIKSARSKADDRKQWVGEMAAAREAAVDPEEMTPRELWDDLRSDRI